MTSFVLGLDVEKLFELSCYLNDIYSSSMMRLAEHRKREIENMRDSFICIGLLFVEIALL